MIIKKANGQGTVKFVRLHWNLLDRAAVKHHLRLEADSSDLRGFGVEAVEMGWTICKKLIPQIPNHIADVKAQWQYMIFLYYKMGSCPKPSCWLGNMRPQCHWQADWIQGTPAVGRTGLPQLNESFFHDSNIQWFNFLNWSPIPSARQLYFSHMLEAKAHEGAVSCRKVSGTSWRRPPHSAGHFGDENAL